MRILNDFHNALKSASGRLWRRITAIVVIGAANSQPSSDGSSSSRRPDSEPSDASINDQPGSNGSSLVQSTTRKETWWHLFERRAILKPKAQFVRYVRCHHILMGLILTGIILLGENPSPEGAGGVLPVVPVF